MRFIVYGMNHTTAPVEVRERYALSPEGARGVLERLRTAAPEAVFLPTCNRVEFYLAADDPEVALEAVQGEISRVVRLKPAEFRKYFYRFEGVEAFLHLFRVAASLDSMVVGEAQVLGQVKEAFQHSLDWGRTGAFLNGVFSRAFAAAKKVRSQTEIARMPVSVPSVAVDMARRIFADLSEHPVLLLGAGEMGELTAKYLSGLGVPELWIANRTLGKAKVLASKLGGEALGLEEGLLRMDRADIILVSVGAGFRMGKGMVEKALKGRGGRSLFIVDIGVPRNVEPEVGKLEGVFLYNIDDLALIALENQRQRREAVEKAEVLLREGIEDLCDWVEGLETVPAVVKLRGKFEALRKAQWEEFLRKNSGLSEREKASLERLTKDLTAKLLHDPSVRLKGIRSPSDRFEFSRMLDEIFSLTERPGDE
jgi:glutamyl-tRNA reductase